MSDDAAKKLPARKKVLRKSILNISGQCSLWFAWAPGGFVGPTGEGGASLPVYEVKEPGAVQVTITVTDKTQRWRHDPNPACESGANGLDGSNGTPVDSRGLQMPEYQSVDYNSQHIQSINTHMNKLLFIREYNGAAPTAAEPGIQEIVGEGSTYAIAPEVTGIFIGMHDSYEWNNNSGVIQVTVDWL